MTSNCHMESVGSGAGWSNPTGIAIFGAPLRQSTRAYSISKDSSFSASYPLAGDRNKVIIGGLTGPVREAGYTVAPYRMSYNSSRQGLTFLDSSF